MARPRARLKPLVALTMGDPAGVGPEVALRAALLPGVRRVCIPVLVGDAGAIRMAARASGLEVKFRILRGGPEGAGAGPELNVLDLDNLAEGAWSFGKSTSLTGRAAAQAIERAVALALSGRVAAIATAPISKEALQMAGYIYPGHTEFLAHLVGGADPVMTFICGRFRVAHVSSHCSIREACRRVRRPRILRAIALLADALRRLGIREPRIAVSGLNPHAGEGGLFGLEELKQIAPAVEEARKQGLSVEGPLPPDIVFIKHRDSHYDGVVAMYHDQGHIPAKLASFSLRRGARGRVRGVNVTLGLPIVRTSVDHGTALDIAGRGLADGSSMADAVRLAVKLARPSPASISGKG
ncbi:MAG: 4-hydroxythreonine-4-phosphate dehydrogenase PdxA [Nitrospinota bacterium]